MPNTPGIQAVYAMIEERKARLQALGEERHTLDSEIKGLELAVQAFVASEAGVVQARADGGDGKSFTATVTDAIEDILLVERPLHRAEILERARGKGIIIEAETPLHYFGTFLSNDKRFMPKTNKRGYWTLTDEPADAGPESC